MAVQLKAGVADPARYFNLGGCDYEKGDWSIFYVGKRVDDSGAVINEDEIQVGIRNKLHPISTLQDPLLFSNYTDASGTPFASFSALQVSLGTLLDL